MYHYWTSGLFSGVVCIIYI